MREQYPKKNFLSYFKEFNIEHKFCMNKQMNDTGSGDSLGLLFQFTIIGYLTQNIIWIPYNLNESSFS